MTSRQYKRDDQKDLFLKTKPGVYKISNARLGFTKNI